MDNCRLHSKAIKIVCYLSRSRFFIWTFVHTFANIHRDIDIFLIFSDPFSAEN